MKPGGVAGKSGVVPIDAELKFVFLIRIDKWQARRSAKLQSWMF